MKSKTKRYPTKLRLAVHADYITGEYTENELAKKHKLPRGTIASWVKRFDWEAEKTEAFAKVKQSATIRNVENTVNGMVEISDKFARAAADSRSRFMSNLFKLDDMYANRINKMRGNEKVSVKELREAFASYSELQYEMMKCFAAGHWLKNGKTELLACNTLETMRVWFINNHENYVQDINKTIMTTHRILTKQEELDAKNTIPLNAFVYFLDSMKNMIDVFVPAERQGDAADALRLNVKEVRKRIG